MEAEKENSGIDGLKQILVETLESQGKLDAIKAEVRATVFGALNTKLVDTRVAKRKTNTKVSRLLRSEEGTRALEGVIDLLRWAGLNQTLRVLECELPVRDSGRLQDAFEREKPGTVEDEPDLVRALGAAAAPGAGDRSRGPSSPLPQISRKPSSGSRSPSPLKAGASPAAQSPAQAAPAEPMLAQASAVSVEYSEITEEIEEEIEEVLSFVDDDGEDSGIGVQDDGGLQAMDSTTLHAVNSTLSASDHSGELDSDAEGIEVAEF